MCEPLTMARPQPRVDDTTRGHAIGELCVASFGPLSNTQPLAMVQVPVGYTAPPTARPLASPAQCPAAEVELKPKANTPTQGVAQRVPGVALTRMAAGPARTPPVTVGTPSSLPSTYCGHPFREGARSRDITQRIGAKATAVEPPTAQRGRR